ncbi:MAG: glycosyl hydrolase family 95 catalytic domain-containing protein [Mycobacteriales bacterium]
MGHSRRFRLSRRTFLGGAAVTAAGASASGLTAPPARAATPAGVAGAAGGLRLRDEMASPAAWERFMSSQDLVWRRLPDTFFHAPFLGNGGLGAAAYRTPTGARLQFTLGDSRVHDHQDVAGPVNNLGQTAELSRAVWGQARLRIGYLTLDTAGEVTAVDLRLSLWNAELAGTVTTTAGTVAVRAFVHATRDLLVVSARPDAGEAGLSWTFTPYPAVSPRAAHNAPPAGLRQNPPPVVTADPRGGTCVQDLVAGGQTVTAWRVRADGATRTLVASVAHSYPDSAAGERSTTAVDAGVATPLDRLAAEHRAWWHRFYPASFVSIPDARMQSFYWIQLYKMASATRVDRPVVGTCAEWLEDTGWPATWWNLNVQLEYWLLYPTGHAELDSLSRSLERYGDNLTLNVPPAYQADSAAIGRTTQEDLHGAQVAVPGTISKDALPETGNLLWVMHNAWLAYRHTMDDRRLRHVVYPLLRRAVNFHLHFLTEGADGRLHLPATFSPEYALAADCNYDLALLTWGCRTLLAATDRLGIADPLRPRWLDVLDRLVDPPQGPDGLWIGANVPLTSSHRHYSHLLWFYPLNVFDVADPAHRDLLERSIAHWLGLPGALQGYTFTGAASMSTLLGDGDRALGYLDTLLSQYVQPNTMYQEGGSPVIETPLSAAQSVHDMLVAGRGGVIRVFPAVPAAWPDVTVHDLRTEGAFLVSAVRRGGATQFVRLRSLAGEPCQVAPGLPGPYEVRRLSGSRRPVTWDDLGDGTLRLDLRRGDDVVITTRGTHPDLTIAPVAATIPATPWGLP